MLVFSGLICLLQIVPHISDAHGKWWNKDWKHRLPLEIDNTKNARWPLDPEEFPKETWGIKVIEGPLMIGGDDKPFAGIIDELRLYSRILRPEEVSAHYERRNYAYPGPSININIEAEETLN